MLHWVAACQLLNVELYLVLSADGTCYETGPLTFPGIIQRVREGQFADVRKVLRVCFIDGQGSAADITHRVALAIYQNSFEEPIAQGTPVHALIERELSFWHAERATYTPGRRTIFTGRVA